MKTRRNPCRIVCRVDQQGTRPPGQDLPGIVKYATESKSSPNDSPYGHQTGMHPTSGPADLTLTKHHKEKRKGWTREEYKEIMYCFYYALEKPQTNNTEDTFIAWCSPVA